MAYVDDSNRTPVHRWDSANFLMPETLLWGQKHSCQQCLYKEAISVVANSKKMLKLHSSDVFVHA